MELLLLGLDPQKTGTEGTMVDAMVQPMEDYPVSSFRKIKPLSYSASGWLGNSEA